jgi:hypothetical protein
MTNEIRDLILQRLKKDSEKQNTIDVTKCITLGIDDPNDCSVVGRPGFIWVMENFQGGAIFQAFNTSVKTLVGLKIRVSRGSDPTYRRVVVGVDWDEVVGISYTGVPYDLINHATTHEWRDTLPGVDVVNIYPRSIVSFRVYPATGISVGIAQGYYVYDSKSYYYAGEALYDLSVHIPSAGNSVGILLYLNFTDGIVHELIGVEVPSPSEPTYPDIPNDVFQLCYIKLLSSTTQISETNIVKDLRPLYTFGGTAMSDALAMLASELDMEISRHKVEGL